MKHLLIPAIAVSLINITANAEFVTPQEALDRVATSKSAPARRAAAKASKTRLSETINETSGQAAVYVFSSNNDYIITPADDQFPAVLGYGESSSEEMAPAMKYWLEEYARQIEWAQSNPAVVNSRNYDVDHAPIEPLLETKWNQSAPYNNLCPKDNGFNSVTGCVATAMAQIMKYHNWPAQGSGTHTYTTKTLGLTITSDYSESTYDWDNMLPTYGPTANAAQREAVARLMYDCGTSVNMTYTAGESGAVSFYVATALRDFFGYDKSVSYYERAYFTESEWEELIYNQLCNYGPVQYSGQSNYGGHSFVCDGYSSNGYFHINWGWGGISDGYFLLSALNPSAQGIGGSAAGYNFTQNIVANIRPAEAGSEEIEQMVFDNNFLFSTLTTKPGREIYVQGPIYNLSSDTISCNLGVKLVDEAGNVSYIKGRDLTNCPPMSGVTKYPITFPADIKEGVYTATPVFCNAAGVWKDSSVKISNIKDAKLTVTSDRIKITDGSKPSIWVEDVMTMSAFYIGSEFNLKGFIHNTSDKEYYGAIRAILVNNKGQLVARGLDEAVSIGAGEYQSISYVSEFYSISASLVLEPGEYRLCFARIQDGAVITTSSYKTITLSAAPENTEIAISDLHILNGSEDAVEKSAFTITMDVTCTEGYYAEPIMLAIYPYSDAPVAAVAQYTTEPIFLEAGETRTIEIEASLPEGTDGASYMATVYASQPIAQSEDAANNEMIFRLEGGMTTGNIEFAEANDITFDGYSVKVNGESSSIEVYNTNGSLMAAINGNELDASSLNSGAYIARALMADGSTISAKFIK